MQWCTRQTRLTRNLALARPSIPTWTGASAVRSYAINPEERLGRALTTLDPKALLPLDCLDLTGSPRVTLNFFSRTGQLGWPPTRLGYAIASKQQGAETWYHIPFPEEAKGFLYYHVPTDGHPLQGEVRFRMTTSRAPSSFQHGKDLLKPNGELWKIPGLELLAGQRFISMRYLLYESGFVDPELLDTLQDNPVLQSVNATNPLVSGLNSPFTLDVNHQNLRAVALGKNGLGVVNLSRVFFDGRKCAKPPYPYTGKVSVCFEWSPLPQHESTRTIVLRLIEEIEPVVTVNPDYDYFILKPEPGYVVNGIRGRKVDFWAVDLDRPKLEQEELAKSLSLLVAGSESRKVMSPLHLAF